MARVRIDAVEEAKTETFEATGDNYLNQLIAKYGEQNTQLNSLKKTVADMNNELKTAIKVSGYQNQSLVADGWDCKLSITDDIVVNEEKLIEVLKAHNIDAIKVEEHVDSDALEKLVYAGKLSEDVLLEIDRCNTTVKKERLTCTKAKGA